MKTPTPSRPRVSVVMAMHNAAATVEQAVRSLQAQTEGSWEVLVVNDGSTDESAEIVRTLAAREPRIRLIEQKQGGPGAARNRGLDEAEGEFVAFLDADDWLEPRAYEHLIAAAKVTGAACGRCRMCDPRGRAIRWPEPVASGAPIGVSDLVDGECFAIHAQIVRRELVGETRFRTDLPCCEDLEFFLALAQKGARWARDSHLVCWYRLRPRQRGTADYAAKFGAIRGILEKPPHSAAAASIAARAFNFATMMVLQDPTLNNASRVVSGLGFEPRFTAQQAALAAHAYLPLSEETGMDAWQVHLDRYASRLRGWWDRCVREGWMEASAPAAAIPLLAHLIANELDVPGDLADELEPERPIVVLGLGINGVRMAQTLASRGLKFSVRDDAVTPADLAERIPGISATLIEASAPFEANAQHVMTLLHDEGFLRKLPAGLEMARWSETVQRISRSVAAQLERSLLPRPLVAPAASKRPVDLFLGSFKRPEKLAAMIESVRDTGYPARVLVAAGDPGTIATCERYPGIAECVYNTLNNKRIGCTAPLNHVYKSLVRHDALFCTDDCVFDKDALDIAMETLYSKFPDGDGVVGLKQENIPDGYDLAFPLMGRKFLDRFAPAASGKDVFFPGFYHLFNDAEIGITIKCLGNWVFEPRATIRHLHPAHGGTLDKTHNHGLTYRQHDEALWRQRRAKGLIWGIDA